MKISTRSTKQNLAILTLGGTLLLAGAAVFFIAPTIRKVRSDYSEFYKEKEEIERLVTEGSTEELLERQVRDLRDELDELRGGFITMGKEVDFITFLEGIGASNGLNQMIQLNEPGAHPKTDFFPSAFMTLKLEGPFTNVLRYLTELERSPYYINITSLMLTSGERLSVTVSGEVFWQHEQQK